MLMAPARSMMLGGFLVATLGCALALLAATTAGETRVTRGIFNDGISVVGRLASFGTVCVWVMILLATTGNEWSETSSLGAAGQPNLCVAQNEYAALFFNASRQYIWQDPSVTCGGGSFGPTTLVIGGSRIVSGACYCAGGELCVDPNSTEPYGGGECQSIELPGDVNLTGWSKQDCSACVCREFTTTTTTTITTTTVTTIPTTTTTTVTTTPVPDRRRASSDPEDITASPQSCRSSGDCAVHGTNTCSDGTCFECPGATTFGLWSLCVSVQVPLFHLDDVTTSVCILYGDHLVTPPSTTPVSTSDRFEALNFDSNRRACAACLILAVLFAALADLFSEMPQIAFALMTLGGFGAMVAMAAWVYLQEEIAKAAAEKLSYARDGWLVVGAWMLAWATAILMLFEGRRKSVSTSAEKQSEV